MRWFFVLLIAATASGQKDNRYWREDTDVATIHRWISTDGDFDAAGSWSSGVKPSTPWNPLDEVIFGADSVVDAVTNLDQNAVPVTHFTIQPGYSGNIGGPGNQLKIGISVTAGQADLFIHRGTGTVYADLSTGASADVVLDSPNLTNALYLDGGIRNLFVKRGWCEIDAGAVLQHRIHVLGSDAILSIPTAGGSETSQLQLLMEAGTVTCGRLTSTVAGNTMFLHGGTWTQTGALSTETNIVIQGGELIYKPLAATAELPELYAISGILDLSQSTKATQFTNHIIGPDMDILGDFATGGFTSGTSVAIDLREDYPR